jgi:hypothetical protein
MLPCVSKFFARLVTFFLSKMFLSFLLEKSVCHKQSQQLRRRFNWKHTISVSLAAEITKTRNFLRSVSVNKCHSAPQLEGPNPLRLDLKIDASLLLWTNLPVLKMAAKILTTIRNLLSLSLSLILFTLSLFSLCI